MTSSTGTLNVLLDLLREEDPEAHKAVHLALELGPRLQKMVEADERMAREIKHLALRESRQTRYCNDESLSDHGILYWRKLRQTTRGRFATLNSVREGP